MELYRNAIRIPIGFDWNSSGIFLSNCGEILLEMHSVFSKIRVKFQWNLCQKMVCQMKSSRNIKRLRLNLGAVQIKHF